MKTIADGAIGSQSPEQRTEKATGETSMSAPTWTDADTARALQIWAEYQKQHDVTDRIGQAVGIDPVSGRVWFGESAIEVVKNMRAEGVDRPLFGLRVGYDHYLRKGSRR